MSDFNSNDGGHHPSSFDTLAEQWFSEQPARRPSQRPTSPAPALVPVPGIDDSIADGWFLDL
jgi:hypothetical protein